MYDTLPHLIGSDFPRIRRRQTEILQVNIGLRCNQQCVHCHVNASPRRTEQMDANTMTAVLDYLQASDDIHTLDITGGAPELHPQFRSLVVQARALGVKVIDRCNLTILNEPNQADLAEFLAKNQVEIQASLPCYQQANVDKQRGKGVFALSVQGLQTLNKLGYGRADSGLCLNLVYNPQGPALPPPQESLEAAYKTLLKRDYGIDFNHLYTLCNMPIKRFGSMLISKGTLSSYLKLLKRAHDDGNLEKVMCVSMLSVDWQGYIYDCDFNQMLGLGMTVDGRRLHISELPRRQLAGKPIRVGKHCYGCTAGQGSSCGGALMGTA